MDRDRNVYSIYTYLLANVPQISMQRYAQQVGLPLEGNSMRVAQIIAQNLDQEGYTLQLVKSPPVRPNRPIPEFTNSIVPQMTVIAPVSQRPIPPPTSRYQVPLSNRTLTEEVGPYNPLPPVEELLRRVPYTPTSWTQPRY